MREVDRLMVEELGITLLQMMEQAGHHLARLAQRLAGRSARSGQAVLVLAGRGNNGGGGLVAARHLHRWGLEVRVALAAPPEVYDGVPSHQLGVLRKLGIPVAHEIAPEQLRGAGLVIDALVGYGLEGPPRGPVADLIRAANESRARILSLDVPSGLDATSGVPHEPCIRARATLTLALPKTGLLRREARPFVGRLYLADIGVPELVVRRLGLTMGPAFTRGDILALGPAAQRR